MMEKNHAWADETSVDALKNSFEFHLKHSLADDHLSATKRDLYTSLALSVRDRLIKKWLLWQHSYYENDLELPEQIGETLEILERMEINKE